MPSGLLSFLQGAIIPTGDAVASYDQGQQIGKERQAQATANANAAKRQSALDQIKASLDQSTIDRNKAVSDKDERTPAPKDTYDIAHNDGTNGDGNLYAVNKNNPQDIVPLIGPDGRPLSAKSAGSERPDTISTTKGIMQWDQTANEGKGGWTPTGMTSAAVPGATTHAEDRDYDVTHPLPPTANETATQQRANAEAALKAATEGMPHPSKLLPPPGSANADQRPAIMATPAYQQTVRDSLARMPAYNRASQAVQDLPLGTNVPLGTTTPATPTPGTAALTPSPAAENPVVTSRNAMGAPTSVAPSGPVASVRQAVTGPSSGLPPVDPTKAAAVSQQLDSANKLLQTILASPTSTAAQKAQAKALYAKHLQELGMTGGGQPQ